MEPQLAWGVGTSAVATEVVVADGPVRWLGLFAAAPADRSTDGLARSIVESVWRGSFAEPAHAASLDGLLHAADVADRALRAAFSPSDPAGRGAAALVRADAAGIEVAGSASVTVYRVRSKTVVTTWTADAESGDHPSVDRPAYLGGRPSDSGAIDATWMRHPWTPGLAGDRVVVATRDVRVWLRGRELGALASQGTPEAAAQTLAEVCRMRGGGIEVGVAVLHWGPAVAEEEATDPRFAELLASLAGLEDQLARHSLPPEATPIADDDDATAGFAPERDHRGPTVEGELSLPRLTLDGSLDGHERFVPVPARPAAAPPPPPVRRVAWWPWAAAAATTGLLALALALVARGLVA